MRRRELVTGAAAATVLTPLRAYAQSHELPLLVWFASATPAAASRYIGFLEQGLQELGYAKDRDFTLTGRFAENRVERLPTVAEEVIALRPAIIIAGAVDTAFASKKVTSIIPIVSGALADAVHLGLIESYQRPGGNMTGITPYIDELPAKQMEVAREVVSGAKKVGLLGNLNDPKAPPQRDELEQAARKLGVTLVVPEVHSPEDLDRAVAKLANEKVNVVIVLQTTMLLGQRRRVAELMAQARLPAVYGYREHVDEGGLVSYGVDLAWCWRRAATYVNKILKGAAPGDLPVEFPPRVQMVVSLKAAKSLGITIAPLLLARADEVID